MIGKLFGRPGRQIDLYAEAQALIDDGLDLEFVLALYPDDADWLEPLLDTGIVIGETFAAEEPSYFYEASLKTRFVEAGLEKASRRLQPAPVEAPVAPVLDAPAPGLSRFSGAMAGVAASLVMVLLSVATFGIITADNAVPGDWNYAFKLAGERLEYSLSSGDQRVNLQLRHLQTRVEEVKKLNDRGEVSPEVIQDLRNDLQDVQTTIQQRPLDTLQANNVKAIGEGASVVLQEVKKEQPALADEVDDAISVAAGLGTVTTTIPPTPTPTVTPTATPTAEPSPTAESSPTPTAEPGTTATPEPTGTATSEPGGTATAEPSPSPGGQPTSEASPTTTAGGGPADDGALP